MECGEEVQIAIKGEGVHSGREDKEEERWRERGLKNRRKRSLTEGRG